MTYIPELDDLSKFDAYIASIDARLKGQNIPITARPLMAPCLITEDHPITITLGDERWKRINAWFEQRYGQRLNVDFSLGTSVVIVGGDAYPVHLPLAYGRVQVNPLEWIRGATAALLRSLLSTELEALANRCIWLFEAFRDIARLPPETTIDLRTAAEHITRLPPQYGLSKWASLQSAEKALKSSIRSAGGIPPNTHHLQRLVAQAAHLGAPALDLLAIARIQCEAGVRYGEIPVSVTEALDAHYASLEICHALAGKGPASRRVA